MSKLQIDWIGLLAIALISYGCGLWSMPSWLWDFTLLRVLVIANGGGLVLVSVYTFLKLRR